MRKARKSIHENPWYILATLFGEQTGVELDRALHEKNMAAWNSWALHNLNDSEQEELIQRYGVFKGEVLPWVEVEPLFYRRLKDALGERIVINLTGKVQEISVPSPIDEIDMSGLIFERIFCIEGFYFPAFANFNGSKFLSEFESGWSVFSGSAAFNNVVFSKICDFSDAKFFSAANFNEAKFNYEAHWICTHFFDSVGFREAIFNEMVNFQSAQFEKGASFTSAKMHSDAWFYSARFRGTVSFWKASFEGRLTMIETKFEGVEKGDRPDFSDAVFELPANFRSAKFKRFYPNFRGSLLHERSIFSADEVCWPKGIPEDLAGSRETCSLLRSLVERQGFIEDAHFFFRKELSFLARMGSLPERTPYIMYGAISNFGYSIARPLYSVFLLYLFGVLFFWGGFYVMKSDNPLQISLALSFNNVFPFFGFGRAYFEADFFQSMHVVAKIFSALQSIISLPLLFLLGLGLRTRFRMR